MMAEEFEIKTHPFVCDWSGNKKPGTMQAKFRYTDDHGNPKSVLTIAQQGGGITVSLTEMTAMSVMASMTVSDKNFVEMMVEMLRHYGYEVKVPDVLPVLIWDEVSGA